MKIKSIIAASLAVVTVGTFTVLGMTGVLTDNENTTSPAESISEVSIVSEIISSQETSSGIASSEVVSSEVVSSEPTSSESTSNIVESSEEIISQFTTSAGAVVVQYKDKPCAVESSRPSIYDGVQSINSDSSAIDSSAITSSTAQ